MTDAAWVAALFAVDPAGLGGVALRARAGPRREAWLADLTALLPTGAPLRRVPLHIGDERLLGGLDLAATLQAGRPIAQRGVLSEADGGVVLLAMAERLSPSTAARLAAVLDTQHVAMERDGLGTRLPTRVGFVALDEGIADDEGLPARLLERLAFHLPLEEVAGRLVIDAPGAGDLARGRLASGHRALACSRAEVAAAQAALSQVTASEAVIEALCAAALSLGVASIRAPMLALRAAKAAAALNGRREVDDDDAALAARLVLASRATRVPPDARAADEAASQAPPSEPPPELQPEQPPEPPPESDAKDPSAEELDEPPEDAPNEDLGAETDAHAKQGPDDEPRADTPRPQHNEALDDIVLQAVLAAIPPGLLAALKAGQLRSVQSQNAGRSGTPQSSHLRGRPSGVRRGEPRAGARFNVIETLRAAAPWQALRRRELAASAEQRQVAAERVSGAFKSSENGAAGDAAGGADNAARHDANTVPAPRRIQIRREDFHITRFQQRSETTTVFVVDASGSAALHRLAETKGAVELLLADCYVRRDSVAVLAFRGRGADLLLPPTRSLVRAKRSLAGLPGGGGTPLAAGIDAAAALADAIRRRGCTPVIVLLTDGRANISRSGAGGREQATSDALAAARQLRAAGFGALLLDTSPQPQDPARQLADAMGATYLPLPHAGAATLSQAVRAASAPAAGAR
ncbi:magnesium chelatase subunit D [soil metagenome]